MRIDSVYYFLTDLDHSKYDFIFYATASKKLGVDSSYGTSQFPSFPSSYPSFLQYFFKIIKIIAVDRNTSNMLALLITQHNKFLILNKVSKLYVIKII